MAEEIEPPEPAEPPEASEPSTLLPDIFGSAIGGLAGAAIGGPVGIVVGAATGAGAQRLAKRIYLRMQERGEAVLSAAEHESKRTRDELLAELASNDELEALLARIIMASGSTAIKDKLVALGRVLGRTVEDHAKIDEAICLVTALHEMENPHIMVLKRLAQPPPVGPTQSPDQKTGWTRAELADGIPGMDLVITAVQGVLIRSGLAIDVTPGATLGSDQYWQYSVSELGKICLELLGAAVHNDQ